MCHFHWDIATKPVLAAQRARYDDLRRRLAPNQGDFMWRSADDLKKKCRIAGWLPKETRYRQAMEALSEWLNERGAAVRYASVHRLGWELSDMLYLVFPPLQRSVP